MVLAAGGVERSSQPTPSASPSATVNPTDTSSPEPTATPGPSLRDRIGQMLLVGFRGLTVAAAGDIVTDIRDRNLGGIVLFDTDQPTHNKVRMSSPRPS